MSDAQLEPPARESDEVRVAVHEAGKDGASAEIDDRFPGVGVDFRTAARESHAAVAHDESVDDRRARVHRVDASVAEKHAGRPFYPAYN